MNKAGRRRPRAYIPELGFFAIQVDSMPNISERQRLLDDIDQAMKLAAMDAVMRDDDDSDLDEELFPEADPDSLWDDDDESTFETLCKLHYMVCENRFLNPRRNLAKSRDFVLNYFLNQPDDAFRKITRVSRATFNHIIQLIEFDPIFHNVSTCAQAPVHWQLACALDRLGNDGQGVSHARSKLIWGIGQGTVHLYTQRVVKALWSLREIFIKWPTAAERVQIGKRMEAKGFKNCVGFVDGTTIPLHKKPAVFGNVFMDRKKRYSVNAQVVCDDSRRIIFFQTGHPGSSGDSRVFGSSIIVKRPDLAFSGQQYLLADSAYAASPRVVPSYKENHRDCWADIEEPRKIEKFNTYLAKARVVNEHTIGILKARWSSLRGMRVDIHEQDDMKTFVMQATACAVLHNLTLNNDPWEEEFSNEEEEEPEDEPQLVQSRVLTPGQRRRWEVRIACLQFHGQE